MHYWMHHCSHQGGYDILETEGRLTIGFSDCASDPVMFEIVKSKNRTAFEQAYKSFYGGKRWRERWTLWNFVCEMRDGVIVVVLHSESIDIVRLKGRPFDSERPWENDIGWEWKVEQIACAAAPCDKYVSASLLSLMKCRLPIFKIDDFAGDVYDIVDKLCEANTLAASSELSTLCRKWVDTIYESSHFGRLLRNYFTRLGGSVAVISKNDSNWVGDCDIEAVFPALRLTISVQAKKHWGETDDWAIRQIADYAKSRHNGGETEDNWTYVLWVVSFADDFTDNAKKMAKDEGVILINGTDFCKMLVADGLGID